LLCRRSGTWRQDSLQKLLQCSSRTPPPQAVVRGEDEPGDACISSCQHVRSAIQAAGQAHSPCSTLGAHRRCCRSVKNRRMHLPSTPVTTKVAAACALSSPHTRSCQALIHTSVQGPRPHVSPPRVFKNFTLTIAQAVLIVTNFSPGGQPHTLILNTLASGHAPGQTYTSTI
jgi:hypothetical protein